MEIVIIAAVSENGVIGKDGGIPWHIPEDLAHFKNLTWGQWMLMGRGTWDSLPRKPLAHRHHMVITSRPKDFPPTPRAWAFSSPEEALANLAIEQVPKAFIIGGESLYRWGMPRAHTLYITHVHRKVSGDRFFPAIPADFLRESLTQDAQGHCSFGVYKRAHF